MLAFSSAQHPREWASDMFSKRKLEVVTDSNNVTLFHLAQIGYDPSAGREGKFFIYEHPEYKSVYVAITLESADFFNRLLVPFITQRYPRVFMTFISHRHLRQLINDFREITKSREIVVKRASLKLRLGANKPRRLMPMVSWPDMDLDEAFHWVFDNNGWFNSITFNARNQYEGSTEVSISRQGVIKTNANFVRVFQQFVEPICKDIANDIEVYRSRGRRENAFVAKPLIIDFEVEQFADVAENARFIEAMQRMDSSSISVLHGNPYIRLSSIDYLDGSTFDLWVVNTTQLVIVPQLSVSVAAIKRLINHVFDTYAEGRVKDYSKLVE
jgi:hypothetical protein